MAKKGLGRGLEALLTDNAIEEKEHGGITVLKFSDIEPNRAQARKSFDEETLIELADSIKRHGILQPIAVRRKENGYYEIIAGERRWRASKIAGLNEIPAIIKDIGDESATELSLIENLQRENLNPAEEARGYCDLMERFGLTQEEAAERVGKSRAAVANILRLLKLPETVLKEVESGTLSYGHARALIPLAPAYGAEFTAATAERVIRGGLSVRQTESLVKNLLSGAGSREKRDIVGDQYYGRIEREMSDILGRKATLSRKSGGSGVLKLAYSSPEDLEVLIKKLCGSDFFNNEI